MRSGDADRLVISGGNETGDNGEGGLLDGVIGLLGRDVVIEVWRDCVPLDD
jgi:hypothetical protein